MCDISSVQGGVIPAVNPADARRGRSPLVLAVAGLPGSGKTLIARETARVLELEVLSSDAVRKRLAGVALHDRAREEHYTPEFSRRTYAELARLATEELERAGGVIVDATFRSAENRETFVEGLGPGAPAPLFVYCAAPYEVMRGRLEERERDVSDATVEVLDRQRFEPLDDVPPERRLELRTDRPAERALSELEAWLDERT
jgi:predicted kinase